MALLAWIGIGITLAAARRAALAQLLAGSALVVAAPIAWFIYNARSSATGSTSRAVLTRPRPSSCAPPRPAWPAASGLAQSMGLAAVLRQGRGDGRSRSGVGQRSALALSVLGTRRRMARRAPPRLCVDAAAVAAGSLLRLLGRLRIGAHLHPALVAALLVQHALWTGAAAGTRAGPGIRRAASAVGAVRDFKPQWAKIARGRAFASLLAANAWTMMRERPLVYVEGTKNIDARRPFDQNIPPVLRKLARTAARRRRC